MSLLDISMEKCVMLVQAMSPDEYGGKNTTWEEGAEITAAISYDNSLAARTANVQGVTSVYQITTARDTNLQYHDVLRRLSDGKTFRVTSDGDDHKTPLTAGLDMRVVSAEEWELPHE